MGVFLIAWVVLTVTLGVAYAVLFWRRAVHVRKLAEFDRKCQEEMPKFIIDIQSEIGDAQKLYDSLRDRSQ